MKEKKEKKRKKSRWLKWMCILPLVVVMLFFGLHIARKEIWSHEKKHFEQTAFSQTREQYFSQRQERFDNFQGERSEWKYQGNDDVHHREHYGEKERIRGEHHEEVFDGIFFIPFLLDLVLVLFGWMLLRKSEGNAAKKWTSILLLVIGLLPILPILMLVAGITWIYKKFKHRKETINWIADEYIDEFTTLTPATHILDEWEQNIRKEEQ